MAAIQIAQLCAAPNDLWRFHALTDSPAPGDAVVYISRVLALGLVDDAHDPERGVAQRFAVIDVDAAQSGLEDYHCVGSHPDWSTEVVQALGLEEALDVAEKWWRQVCRGALAGHDIAPRFRRSGMNCWELHAGPCASGCARCTVESAYEKRRPKQVVLDERYLRGLHLELLLPLLTHHGIVVPEYVDRNSAAAIVDWMCSQYGVPE